ncbi:alanine--tRNA ligase [Candidatus Bathyarchaeota archaeon]|nr:MAG: alanine--tRNA ligase [Candidatus Bathyarchaeota archaeon]
MLVHPLEAISECSELKFTEEEYNVPFFKEFGYVRKLCPKCGKYFWTQNLSQETCGEASSEECAFYTFINNPPTKKSYSLREMREAFLSFFEKRGHTRIKPYPVVARWRDDIYLTHASIIDFQPYVTNGIAPPPANPLVISQPCIRLVDITNTGPTFGRHLTIFEMGGAHAFNYPDREIYWKDQTVRYHHEWATEELGVKPEEIVYKEEVWSGGGNAGPCLEVIIRGLEVATLVFMQYKVVDGEFVKLPIRTVDPGYGIDRYTWLSQGVLSGFHAVYGDLLDKIFLIAGITHIDRNLLRKVAEVSGLVSLDKTASRLEFRKREASLIGADINELDKFLAPIENAFAVADHTKCLCFMLSEGVVPSNIQEGYLARLVFRRIYRLLRMLGIPDKLYDIVDMQINHWSHDFPHLGEMRNEIMEIIAVEEEKYEETIKRGEGMVKRISGELKAKNQSEIPAETLIELYDSHGLPPEIVQLTAEKEGLKVNVPENFYTLIAQKHLQASKKVEEEKPRERLEIEVTHLPETEPLYYKDQYMREFEAKVIKVINSEYVVLDKTCFYPEGGGQPADSGYLEVNGEKIEVVDVQKVGKVIVHRISGAAVPKEGTNVRGVIDWEKRYALMKAHTATHLINGAARRVLGQHVWQFGTQKGTESSRLDISHHRRLTHEEVHKIEILANQAVLQNMPVETRWMPRSEAESLYGFRLYQGGAVPSKEIRVVATGDWDVEACAGTHIKSTGEIGFIKIVHSERVQDGVERLIYSIGVQALKKVQEEEKLLWKLSEILNAPLEKLDKTAERLVRELKEANAERRRLIKELAAKESTVIGEEHAEEAETIGDVKIVLRDFGESTDVDRMVQTASEIIKKDGNTTAIFYGADEKSARIMVMAGKGALKKGVNAHEIVREASAILGGGGGGKPNFAQGGGTQIEKLQEAVKKAKEILEKQLKHPMSS